MDDPSNTSDLSRFLVLFDRLTLPTITAHLARVDAHLLSLQNLRDALANLVAIKRQDTPLATDLDRILAGNETQAIQAVGEQTDRKATRQTGKRDNVATEKQKPTRGKTGHALTLIKSFLASRTATANQIAAALNITRESAMWHLSHNGHLFRTVGSPNQKRKREWGLISFLQNWDEPVHPENNKENNEENAPTTHRESEQPRDRTPETDAA